jgi:hypothetical protein
MGHKTRTACISTWTNQPLVTLFILNIGSVGCSHTLKSSLCLIKHHMLNTCGKVEVQLFAFLMLALIGAELLASHPNCFTLGQRAYGAHWMIGQVGSGTLFCAVKKGEISRLLGVKRRLLGHRPHGLVTILTEISRFSYIVCLFLNL